MHSKDTNSPYIDLQVQYKLFQNSSNIFLEDIDKLVLKFIQKGKGLRKTTFCKSIKWEQSLCLISRPTIVIKNVAL